MIERKRIENVVTTLLACEIPAPNFKDAGTIGNVRKKINTAIDYAEEICGQIDARKYAEDETLDRFASRVLMGLGMPTPPTPMVEAIEKLRKSGELRPGTLISPDGTVTHLPDPVHKEWVDELLNQNAPSETTPATPADEFVENALKSVT